MVSFHQFVYLFLSHWLWFCCCNVRHRLLEDMLHLSADIEGLKLTPIVQTALPPPLDTISVVSQSVVQVNTKISVVTFLFALLNFCKC